MAKRSSAAIAFKLFGSLFVAEIIRDYRSTRRAKRSEMAWPMPRVPPVIKIVLLRKENRSFPLALMRIQSLFLHETIVIRGLPNELFTEPGRDSASESAVYAWYPLSAPNTPGLSSLDRIV